MRHTIKNIKLDGAESDSGWVVAYEGRCYTTWHRTIASKVPHDILGRTLVEAGDYPGWTGVEYCKHFSNEGLIVFSSTWDSSD